MKNCSDGIFFNCPQEKLIQHTPSDSAIMYVKLSPPLPKMTLKTHIRVLLSPVAHIIHIQTQ